MSRGRPKYQKEVSDFINYYKLCNKTPPTKHDYRNFLFDVLADKNEIKYEAINQYIDRFFDSISAKYPIKYLTRRGNRIDLL